MALTVSELIDILSDMNPDAEVRLAHQPNYPIWSVAGSVKAGSDDPRDADEPAGYTDEGEPIAADPIDPETAEYVYILESPWESGGYASSSLWDEEEI